MLLPTLRETVLSLRQRGIEAETAMDDPVPATKLAELESAHQLTLPNELREIYLNESDGFYLCWEHENTGGVFFLPTIADLIADIKPFRDNVADFADDPHSMDRCIQPPHRPAAFTIWNSMRTWLPLYAESDGDTFCIRAEDGVVVYNQHDWFDGFGAIATTNGLIAGDSLEDFVQNWSRFYFMSPKSLHWPTCAKDNRIDWNPQHFHPDYLRF